MQLEKNPNIVLIVIDALRAKSLGCYGSSFLTPNIDRFANGGTTFSQAFSCANLTDPSITSIFTGKYPISHGIIGHGHSSYDYRKEISRLVFLPEELKRFGYLTFGLDWLGRWHKKGFDFYSGVMGKRGPFRRLKKIVRLLPLFIKRRLERKLSGVYTDTSLPTATAQTRLASFLVREFCNKSFFLFIHYWDTHFPYNTSSFFIDKAQGFWNEGAYVNCEKFDEIIDKICSPFYRNVFRRFAKKGMTPLDMIARYYGAISYVDFEINRLLETLRECGLLNKSIIIITSDHGESLGEHGIFFNHHGLYDVTIHVPLIIQSADLPKTLVECFVQHVDIVPTLLNIIIGKRNSAIGVHDGKSLIKLVQGREENTRKSVLMQEDSWSAGQRIALRTKEYKFISEVSEQTSFCRYCKRRHFPSTELYDLTHDPNELDNLADEDAKSVRKHEKMLDDFMKTLRSYKSEKPRIIKRLSEIKKRTTEQESEKPPIRLGERKNL